MRALLLGFGHVGRRLTEILADPGAYPGLAGLTLAVVGIITAHHGGLASPAGLDLGAALAEYRRLGRFDPAGPGVTALSGLAAAERLDYDVLVELTTLDIANRGEPAAGHLRAALKRGRHVVSANKGPLAFAFAELTDLAQAQGARLLYESTVMDGAPVFNLARAGLRGCRVTGLSGILNSTTNYLLTRMEAGLDLAAALAEAQALGVAEADPSLDLDGWDAAAKLAVLANALMGADLDPTQVDRTGMRGVTPVQAQAVLAQGRRLRLLARAWREGGRVRAWVGPEAIPAEQPLASVAGTGAGLRLETDLMGPLLILQEQPDLSDTASGVLNDLLSLQGGARGPLPGTGAGGGKAAG